MPGPDDIAVPPPAAWLDGGSPEYPRDTPVHVLFSARAAARPDAVALLFGSQSVTYAELEARAGRLARQLVARGLAAGTPVAMCVERSPELVITILAILKAGCCYVPLDSTYPAARLELMAAGSGAPLLVTTRAAHATLPELPIPPVFLEDLAAASVEDIELPEVTSLAPAYLMFTSGSTGRPKGVAIPHRGIARLVLAQTYIDYSPSETILQIGAAAFDASTFEIWGALLNGARLAIAPPGTLALEQIGEIVRAMGVTTMLLTTGLFNLMADEQPEALGAPLRQLLTGGDALTTPHARKVVTAHPRLRLVNAYGPTECTVIACCHTVSAADFDAPTIPIGRPIANTTIRILDEERRPLPPGNEGELYVGGDGLALGYWGQPALTEERFVAIDGSRFYKTGDRARFLPGGAIQFLGRLDAQVKVRGFRIEPGEIEAALSAQPGVLRSAVLAHGEGPDKSLAAYYTGPAEPAAVREALEAILPPYMVPAHLSRMDGLPLTANGKLDRARLPVPGQSDAAPALPGTALEQTIVDLWTELLDRPIPSLDANFFDLGGTSLKLVEAHSRLVRTLRRKFPVTRLFQYPTVSSLAGFLAREEAPAPAGQTPRTSAAAERARLHRESMARKQLPS